MQPYIFKEKGDERNVGIGIGLVEVLIWCFQAGIYMLKIKVCCCTIPLVLFFFFKCEKQLSYPFSFEVSSFLCVFLNCIKMLFHMNTVPMQSGTCQSHFKRVFSPSFLSLVATSAIMFLLLCHMLIFFSLLNSSNVSSSVLPCILSIVLLFFYSYALSPILFAVAQWNVSLWHSFNLIETHMDIFILYI